MMNKILIKNATIITLGTPNRVLDNHEILIEGDKIKSIRPQLSAEVEPGVMIVDASGKVAMPGFINAHTHFYSSFARGLTKAAPSKNFSEILRNLWWRLDKKLVLEDVFFSALTASIDCIRHGTTTVIDHHASPFAVLGSLRKIAEALNQTGLRASLCYELSDRDGHDISEAGIRENLDFLAACSEGVFGSSIKALFGLHASFTLSDKTLEKASSGARKLGAGFHIHTAEDLSDQNSCLANSQCRVVERLDRFGILGTKTLCAHCVHISENEMDILKKTDTAVIHNPQSNMNNAVGVADLIRMSKKGILVGLGTDAMTNHMLEELRSSLWIHRWEYRDLNSSFLESTETLLKNNALIAGRHWPEKFGFLAEGCEADLILIDYSPPTPLNDTSVLGHIVFGLSQSVVDTTMVKGKFLMQNRRLLSVDERTVFSEARKLSTRLWERF